MARQPRRLAVAVIACVVLAVACSSNDDTLDESGTTAPIGAASTSVLEAPPSLASAFLEFASTEPSQDGAAALFADRGVLRIGTDEREWDPSTVGQSSFWVAAVPEGTASILELVRATPGVRTGVGAAPACLGESTTAAAVDGEWIAAPEGQPCPQWFSIRLGNSDGKVDEVEITLVAP